MWSCGDGRIPGNPGFPIRPCNGLASHRAAVLKLMQCCLGTCDIPGYNDAIRLTHWTGEVVSPGYSPRQIYPDLQDCIWFIKVSAGSRVKVRIEFFDLEEGFYQNMSPDGVCEGEVFTEGTIESPNFPDPPPPNVICAWKIGHSTKINRLLKLIEAEYQTSDQVTGLPSNGSALPLCGTSPFKGRDPIAHNFTLVYVPGVQTELWVGRIAMNLTDDDACDWLCPENTECHWDLDHLRPSSVQKTTSPGYNCTCLPGYQGFYCQHLDKCLESACIHGTCEYDSSPGGCICEEGYTGPDCNTTVCGQDVCKNGGVCRIDSQNQANCMCAADGNFTGKYCQIQKGSSGKEDELCADFPALGYRDNFTLVYVPGVQTELWVGRIAMNLTDDDACDWLCPENTECHWDLDHLRPSSVQKTTSPGYNCTCLPGYQGFYCQHLDKCLESACIHGTCEYDSSPGGCICEEGYTGPDCNTTVCGQDVCKNGGVCRIDSQNQANCMCAADGNFTGKYCQIQKVEEKVSGVVASTQRLIAGAVKNLAPKRGAHSDSTGPVVAAQTGSDQGALLNISVRNLDIQVNRLQHNQNSSTGVFDYGAGSSTLSLPVYELDGSHINSPGQAVDVYLARFQSIADLLSIRKATKDYRYQQNTSNIINSDVISAEVLSGNDVSRMRNPVELTFKLQNSTLGESMKPVCVFMNMSATSYRDRWSSDGCFVSSVNDTHVVCHCYHLTNFAVLMDVYSNQKIQNNAARMIPKKKKERPCYTHAKTAPRASSGGQN
ncbi:hypothetical protein EGW08_019260 [Elysia chlorotica]|uniref:Cubilin n=1 Tax=Elysia chlorotica TaxID=188477 RepID=A0A3S1B642_ELYCH|nr:hypothetical protein EGW08_019260 [Elysia chlorotica]